ncbi:MAG: sugar transferase [Clostridia bacterium]|nr:sugar transferase [Clostridia bacterium]MBQ2347141.1 sugar transferase [Clostridia bacterium]MBQ5440074.1 sugar transferase [Clostridia bacterium]
MLLPRYSTLSKQMQNDEVLKYYNILSKRTGSLILKRISDIICALLLIVILAVPMLIVAVCVKADSPGPVFFRQRRVTTGGRVFSIFKFRTMYVNDNAKNAQVTSGTDSRITKTGRTLRKLRLDEMPQLFNVLSGDMTFVGTRPEVERYVEKYTPEMYATLLMPAGITSMTSIKYRNEEEILEKADDVEKAYIEQILPDKMKYNLEYIEKFNFFYDIYIMLLTVVKVFS